MTAHDQIKTHGVFAVLLVGCIICSFVQTALNVAIAPIMAAMSIPASDAQWLTSTYSLVMGIMVLATAFLIRRFPARPLFIVTMSVFIIGLGMAALAENFSVLLLGRLLQAVGCGVLLSLTQVIILTIYPKNKRGVIMGTFGLAVTAAPVLAPTLAGILIDQSSWQMIFWISLAFSILVLIGGLVLISNVTAIEKQRFDFLSMLLCAVGLSGVLFGLGQFGKYSFVNERVWLPLLLGTAAILGFVWRQLKLPKPFIDLQVFRSRPFRLAVIFSMVLYCVLIAGSILIPIYSQSLRGFSATVSGLITMPGSLVTALCSLLAGKLYDRIGIRKIAIGGCIFLLFGSAGLILLGAETSVAQIISFFIIRQIGIGFLMMPIFTWGMSQLSYTQYADGTSLISSLRTVAGAMGAAAFVSVMTAAGSLLPASGRFGGIQAAFILMAMMILALLVMAIFAIGSPVSSATD